MNAILAWFRKHRLSESTIKTKLRFSLMLAASAAPIVAGALFVLANSRLAVRSMGDNLSALADVMAENSSAALAFDDAKAAQETLASLGQDPNIAAACIYRKNGEVFAVFAASSEKFTPPAAEGIRRGMDSEGYMTAFKEISDKHGRIGTLYLKARTDQLRAANRQSVEIIGAVLAGSLVLAWLLAHVLQYLVARPILELSAAAQAITDRRDYSIRVQKRSNDELGALCECFNEMLTQIERRRGEIEQHRIHLEELVKERTLDLEAKTKEAQAATVAKSQFLANMSHEIRTPMNGVIGMLRLLRSTPLEKKQERYMTTAITAADTLLTIINDILDFSKVEAGKLEVERLDFNLLDTVEAVAQTFADRARKNNVELACQVAPTLPARLRGDPNRLAQILSNFTSNAIKFTWDGEVVIMASAEHETATHVTVRLAVRDTGIGIPRAQQVKLFQPFVQGDSSTTRKYGGTGLGLAICRQLAELMGGSIGMESKQGHGSTFWLTLKLEKQTGAAPAGVTPRQPVCLRGLPILVVDDNETNREILRQQITAWGCNVQDAPDGATALSLLRRAAEAGKPIRAAVIDKNMPAMDGEELAAAIRAEPRFGQTILIMLSSSGDEGEKVRQLGFAACLSKPARQSELLDAMVTALAQGRGGNDPRSTNAAGHPAAPDTTKSPAGGAAADGPKRPGRILLAEDNEINREVATEVLRTLGYECDCAVNGVEAFKAAATGAYDLILMDCQMPEMDGFEAAGKIREMEALGGPGAPHIPIVALTANAMQGDRERCIAAGMDDYLPKPLEPEQVASAIQRHLGRSVPVRAHMKNIGGAHCGAGPSGPAIDARAGGPVPTLGSLPARVSALESADAGDEPVWNYAEVLKRCSGSATFVSTIVKKFNARARADAEEMETAFRDGNGQLLASIAHRMKGASASVSAVALSKAAASVEASARAGNLPEAGGCLKRVQSELDRFDQTAERMLLNLEAPVQASALQRE